MDEIALRIAESIADRYRIERKLGAGGMANVYLARDLRYDRDTAIKVMRPELAETLGVQRFLREIRLLAHLQHPNILSLVDSGEAGGLVYYVMPYLAGGSLRDRLNHERELPIADAIQILREAAGALAHAHSNGIVHRDIKPENILFNAGHVQVSDFGIARMISGDNPDHELATTLTAVGLTMGTPQYMAPEQAAGDPNTDHRADLYALGVLAYESLSGAPPFVAGSAAQLSMLRLTQEPAPLSRQRSSVPAALEEAVRRCLQVRPADRWQSAEELLAALDRAVRPDGTSISGSRRGGTITARMPVTETLARKLDRRSFDPRMIGDSLEYLDNQAESDVLVMMLNAVWLDGSDFETHLRTLPYHCIAPTLYGFEPRPRYRMALPLRDHILFLSELLSVTVKESNPSLVIVVGFSASGDFVLQLASSTPAGVRAPDGVLALGPNQGVETCFISRVLAKLESNDPVKLLAALRTISETASSVDEWMLLNGYLGRIMARFRDDLSPLCRLGRDLVQPFERDGPEAFAQMYREAAARARLVRCVFEDTDTCKGLLRTVLTDHMDRQILGEHHRDGSLLIEPTPSHFELIQPERIAAHLAAMVEELRAAKS
ncbi:MAG TPA: serine/threonine-protein kinase [Candidatus Polarisedimenticolia bacterium]|nr:serine/threonine-protein kinase [Candidatus Polarisedimenticolia bacterium]